jgi:4-hydroxy-3-polyprenylbenzoate decarboxylase
MAELQIRDLREWLDEVEKIGELLCINEEVDPHLEMSAITYLVAKKPNAPALLFTNPKGHKGDVKVLFNVIGNSLNRLSLALRLRPGRRPMELVEYLKGKMTRKIPPVTVAPEKAPIYENIWTDDQVNLFYFPAPTHWPRDGGPYIGTADVIITQDPETGRINLGTYRQMVLGKDRVGFYTSPGKDAMLDREKWWAKGKPCPVVSVYGVDPLLFICAATGFPKQESEYDYAGGLQDAPIEVVPGKITGLPIPARAEIAIEGYSYPGQELPEGPFGEFTGYYGRPGEAKTPFIEVKAIYFRNQPILTAALMADHPSCEQNLFMGVMRGAKVWRDLEAVGVPGVKGVWSVPAAAGGFGMIVVSLQQQYPGHAQQAAAIAAQCAGGAYYTKFVIVVDEDVDPSDLEQVVWAMATRCRVSEDIDILRNTWSTYLDPSKNPPEERPYGSKALIFACKEFKYIKTFARRTALTQEQYKTVCNRWKKLGLPGEPPLITYFDDLTEKIST